MKLDHNSDKPLHIQAEEILRRLIESEEYKNGKLFPNEVELSEQLHISREYTHIGMFEKEECEETIRLSKIRIEKYKKQRSEIFEWI